MKIGIDLGGSHIGIGVVDNENKILKKFEKYFYGKEKENIIFAIENYLRKTIDLLKEEYEIEKIGIAIPGVAKYGKILKTVNLGIYDYDITSFIHTIIDVPVIVRNDGKCATLAEYNNLNRLDLNMLFLCIGTGIGGGVVYNGKLLQGNEYDGFEMGHMVIKADGLPCKCGKKGCFEKYGSILEHKNKIKNILNINEEINGDELRKIMQENYKKIEDIENEYISDLSLGISNLINIFEPDVIVLGGGFTHFSDMYILNIKDKLINSNLLFNKRENIDLRAAKFENDAGIIGATL